MQQFKVHKTVFDVPGPDELTFNQFIQLQQAESGQSKIQAFIDAPLLAIPSTSKVEKQMADLFQAIESLEQAVLLTLNQPKQEMLFTCRINNVLVKIDAELGKQPYWAMVKCKEALAETSTEPSVLYNHYKTLAGHFTYCMVTGKKYNEYEAEAYSNDTIGKTSFKTVIRIGDFYLKNAIMYVNAEREILQAEIPSNGAPDRSELFGEFGELNVLDQLSDGNMLLWEQIKGMPFEVVLTKRKMKLSQMLYDQQMDEFYKSKRQA